ncbi:MAG: histidinol dehydrogenase [Verrucomicrobiota bacterium]
MRDEAEYQDVRAAGVAEIVADVRERGDVALREWSERLGDGVPGRVDPRGDLDPEMLQALRSLVTAVEIVHAVQRPTDTAVAPLPGLEVTRRWLPIDSVGIYVPSGLPSSLVMTAVPARLAGVERIAVATPRPSEAMLATAYELGIEELYSMGGAQAIAALAYGTETVAPVAKIVGPGNRWVTEAKLLVSSRVAVDLPAGPSEVLVIADETADPADCASDLLAQAEHGPDGKSILLTTSPELAAAVAARAEGRAQIELLGSLDEALRRANEIAPEHLELLVGDPAALAAGVRNAGAVFLGTSAVLGDYAAGSNHVLPTGGLARGVGGLGLEAFLKPVQFVSATPEAVVSMRPTVEAFATLEALPLHAESLAVRT